jgi:hypothetical protein
VVFTRLTKRPARAVRSHPSLPRASPLRLAGGGWAAAAAAGVLRGCLHQEQDALADVALGAISATGQLLSAAITHSCQRDVHHKLDTTAARAAREARAEIFAEAMDWRTVFRTEEARVPPDWRAVVGANSTLLKWLELRMPNARGWPARFGGDWSRAFGEPLVSGNVTTGAAPAANASSAAGGGSGGGAAAAFLAQLRADCPDCPGWPDPYDSSLADAADAVAPERLLLMPLWLGHGFALSGTRLRGSEGWWDSRTLGGAPPRQVMGHVWAVPGGEYGKRAVHMALGELDWRKAERVREVTTAGGQATAWSACTHHPAWYDAAGGAEAAATAGPYARRSGGAVPDIRSMLARRRRRGGGGGGGASRGNSTGAGPGSDPCELRLLALHPNVSGPHTAVAVCMLKKGGAIGGAWDPLS